MDSINKKSQIATFCTKSFPSAVCAYLMSRGVFFCYDPETGISFNATASFVAEMSRRLVTAYGCEHYPIYQITV